MGSISIFEGQEPEQMLIGKHNDMQIVVLGVKPSEESVQDCWEAACKIADLDAFAGSPALIIDIVKAMVRHGYITDMNEA